MAPKFRDAIDSDHQVGFIGESCEHFKSFPLNLSVFVRRSCSFVVKLKILISIHIDFRSLCWAKFRLWPTEYRCIFALYWFTSDVQNFNLWLGIQKFTKIDRCEKIKLILYFYGVDSAVKEDVKDVTLDLLKVVGFEFESIEPHRSILNTEIREVCGSKCVSHQPMVF